MSYPEWSPAGRGSWRGVLVLLACLLFSVDASASSARKRNLVELIQESDSILVGAVQNITDGIDARGVPYTEVTLRVDEKLRGKHEGGTYTFRQFGLRAPRKMSNGRTLMAVTPDGWSRYVKDERVVMFLYAPARITGLQTTVGLQQGKLRISNNRVLNAADNEGLFDGVIVSPSLLKQEEASMLATKRGAVDAEAFLGLVRRAVKENWVSQGRMKNVR
ncbi:hypothetical protein [Vitiosangium sp. GDMCC 1.1324]|uniref:hypothetical protein n=1 Tax=Vitiosangium sp. (strain GDMCC 1.1324) TaxID=2138576 RepID=UPI000D37AA5C|nr:hypothetical protein [Vitiosangium sp. GDMCC 1.1324]PTL84874.1 hypothetical protein DAT35_07410 [Vitiosangium sp. GDMCC 1.1324]